MKKRPAPKRIWIAFDGDDDGVATFRTKGEAVEFAKDENARFLGDYRVFGPFVRAPNFSATPIRGTDTKEKS